MPPSRRPQIKTGSKVRVKQTGEELVVYRYERGKPYPYYCAAEGAPDDTPLAPYGKDELELLEP